MERPTYNVRRYSLDLAIWAAAFISLLAFVLAIARSAAGNDVPNAVPTFTKDVAPILFKNCTRCHQTGELASRVPLTSYKTVLPLADLIKQKVMTREMPPWPADSASSLKFRNDPRLSQQDIDTIVAWVNYGHAQRRRGANCRRFRNLRTVWSASSGPEAGPRHLSAGGTCTCPLKVPYLT